MTFATLIKQPWFQVLLGILLVIGLIFGIYYYGKSVGRAQVSDEFDRRQAETLKKAQAALNAADASAARAIESEAYALKLKESISMDRQKAADSALKATAVYENSIQEINDKYETDKSKINDDSLTPCDRCRDLCQSAEQLAKYGAEFNQYRCHANSCADACAP